jgi:hypothetical protein
MEKMDGVSVAILATGFFGYLTTISTLLYQGWARARDRRWDQQDRALNAMAEATHREQVLVKIAENTVLTVGAAAKADAAYSEANQVNMKIAAIGLQGLSEKEPRA